MSTKRQRHQQLVTDRAGKLENLEALRAERSAAIIEGVAFRQTGEILALESDIDALDAAIITADQLADAEEVREIAAQMAQTLAAQDEAACLAVDKFAKAAALAEAGFRQAVKALADMDELAAYIQRTVGPYNYPAHLGDAKPVTVPEIAAVSSMTLRGRISERIQQTLNPLSPEHGNYGHMTWAVAHARSDEDWATEERKILEGGLSLCRRTISQQIREYEIAARPA